MNRTSRLALGCAVLVIAVPCAPSKGRAQSATQEVTGGASKSEQIEEVVVTAQKRAETAQTTPIALTVYTASDLARDGVVDIPSLSIVDPSLNLTIGSGNNPYLTLRGVSSQDTTEIGDPAVPVATDGFFTNRPFALLTTMYDLTRVEVLRGPQGTLYGRNAIGGVVNLITAKPSDRFEAQGTVEIGNYNTVNATGAINIPFSDAVQLRVAAASNYHEGYRKIELPPDSPPTRGDDQNSHSGRVELAVAPIDHFYGLVTAQIDEINEVGTAADKIQFVPNPAIPGDILHTLPPLGDVNQFPNLTQPFFQLDDKTAKLELRYDALPGATQIVYLGGFDSLNVHLGFPANGIIGLPFDVPASLLANEYVRTQNHELRLVSPSGERFTWQAGLYYFEERNENLYNHGGAQFPGTSSPTELAAFILPLVEDASRAVYGQGDFKVTDTLHVSAGARYTHDDKERIGTENVYLFHLSLPYNGSWDGSKVTGHLGAEWNPIADNFNYFKVDTGYKAGGFAGCGSYGPETVTTYEVGSKNELLDRSLQINVAGYLSEYKDQQVQTLVPTSVCIAGSTVQNAGRSRIYGIESDLRAIVEAVGRFDLTVNYTHARFTDFVAAPGIPAAVADCAEPLASGNCQLSGNSLPRSPDWSVLAAFDHIFALHDSMSLDARVEVRYQSKQYFDVFNYGSTTQPGYALANAYLDLSGGTWLVGAWVRNLTDKLYFTDMEELYRDGSYSYSFGAPLTYGLRFSLTLH